MKQLTRYIGTALVAGFLAASASVFAAACCNKATEQAKEGKACANCVKSDCCKEAVKKLGDQAKACEKCKKS